MPDDSIKTIKLSDFVGKKMVILFFYPADFTFVCASEVPGYNKIFEEFEKRDVAILGCSGDTVHAHKAWKALKPEDGGIGPIKFPILGDVKREIAEDYDVMQSHGVCCRATFIIGKDGIIKAEHRNTDYLGRNIEEALRMVDAIKFHEDAKARGEDIVCPASWTLGKVGMTPSTEGVKEFAAGGLDKYVAN